MMKKYLCLLCAICIMAMGIPTAFSAQSLDFTWNGNYKDMTLDITITTPAKYTQTVSVVVYPDGLENPTPMNVTRMTEAELAGGKTTVVSVPLDDDMYTADGKYTVVVQGSGHQYQSSRKTDSGVYILTPGQINGTGGLLNEFNNAQAQTLAAALAKVQNALKLSECAPQDVSGRYSAFLNIRKNDYNSKFATLDDVKKAWECSQVIIGLGSSDAGVIADVYEKCSALLGIDTTSNEYQTIKGQLYSKMILNSKNIIVDSVADAKKLFEISAAVATVNNADIKSIESVIKKYSETLGISETLINKYDAIETQSTKDLVLVQLCNQDFDYPAEICTEFTNAVNSVTIDNDNSSLGGGSMSGSGGSSGGGFGGGSSSGIGSVDIGSGVSSNDFKDVPGSHWAYLYVNELKSKNVINGYNDGTFKPDNLVTREEFVKMIITANGLYNKDAKCSFDDVSDSFWGRAYIACAVERGIVTGISENEFGVGQNITRQDAAVIAYRILKSLGGYSAQQTAESGFTDKNKIGDYAKESVSELSRLNIINGFSDGTFRPEENLTRAQAAKIIALLAELI